MSVICDRLMVSALGPVVRPSWGETSSLMHYHTSFISCWGDSDQVTRVSVARGMVVKLPINK